MCQQKRSEPKIVKPRAEENPRLTVQELLDILIRFYLNQRGLECTCENCRRSRNWKSGPDFQSKQFVTSYYYLPTRLFPVR